MIPYIKGTSETIACILQPYNISVAHKPITTLRLLLTNLKDKDEPKDRQGAVYKIKCYDCRVTYRVYISKSGRNLNARLTKHRRATRNGDLNNNIAEHNLQTNHRINWNSAECVTYSTNYYQQIVLESWFTNLEQTPLNHCLQLTTLFKLLVNDINNRQTTDRLILLSKQYTYRHQGLVVQKPINANSRLIWLYILAKPKSGAPQLFLYWHLQKSAHHMTLPGNLFFCRTTTASPFNHVQTYIFETHFKMKFINGIL